MADLNFSALKEQLIESWDESVVKIRSNQNYQEAERRYRGLNDRDRQIVNVGVVALFLFLLYQLLISPAYGYLSDASRKYKNKLEGHEWMVAKQEQVKDLLNSGDKPKREGSLLSVASKTAKGHNLSFTNFEPVGDDRLRLRLENIKFNDLVTWLGQLELEMGVSAVDISMDNGSSIGYVNARLTLQG